MPWYKVADVEELFALKKIKIGSKSICLIRQENKYYAVSAFCPHAGADLSGGWCKDQHIICPYHRYSYNIITGRGAAGQNDYLNVYQTEQREDGIYVYINTLFNKIRSWLNLIC